MKTFARITMPVIIVTLIILFFSTAFGSNQDKIVENMKSYIQNIKSVAINFEQIDSNGIEASGVLVIDKPYKFRVNYFTPCPLLIVGNKNYVSVYDYEMENLSRIDAKENIFNFLLVDHINFNNQFKVIFAKEIGDHYILKLNHIGSDRISEIEFHKNTQNIEAMKIFEDNNVISLKFGATNNLRKIKSSLFILQDPDIYGKPLYLDKEQLGEYYEK